MKAKNKTYEVGAWKGKPHYRCARCTYSTLQLDSLLTHARVAHNVLITGPAAPAPEIEPEIEPAEDGES